MRVDSIFSEMTTNDDFILKCFSLFLTNKLAPGALFVRWCLFPNTTMSETCKLLSSRWLFCFIDEEVEGGSSAVYYITIVLGSLFIIALVILLIILCKKGYCPPQKCKKQQRPSSPESTVEQGEHVTNTVFKVNKLDPIPGFKAKRPLRIGPIVEPNLDVLPKVEPLYALTNKKDTSKPAKRGSLGSIFTCDISAFLVDRQIPPTEETVKQ